MRSTHLPILSFLRLSVPELCVTQSDHIYHHLEWSLRMRRVTWPITGGGNDPHFWNPWPKFTYINFVTIRELRRSLSHVICEK